MTDRTATTPEREPAHPASDSLAAVPRTAEALDDTVETTTTRAWIALAAIAVLVAAGLAWSLVARLPQQTVATAVVDQRGETYDVVARAAGSVRVTVAPGTRVARGQELGRLTPFPGDTSGAPRAPRPVVAPVAGTVGEILVGDGAGVSAGELLTTITPGSADGRVRSVVTYVPASEAALYTPGDTVSVAVSNLAAGATRVVDATVSSVSEVPSRLEAMRATLRVDDLATKLLEDADGAAYRIELRLRELDALPARDRPVQGQLVEVTNTYDDPHPIELLLGRTT
ncbi:MAG: HlyD family efflux transporter periplasmic adaptor subunit [Solirubrobacterales bacterium]|nr:HlyD family efflux transporter periplasmic adaptor subunit [Solirubrobacterales bacterium]